jgi:hypothetical protein
LEFIKLLIVNNEWSIIPHKGNAPSKRFGHSAVLYKDKMFIFGGSPDGFNTLSDLFYYDFSKYKKKILIIIN